MIDIIALRRDYLRGAFFLAIIDLQYHGLLFHQSVK
jgi:hypothetical protein